MVRLGSSCVVPLWRDVLEAAPWLLRRLFARVNQGTRPAGAGSDRERPDVGRSGSREGASLGGRCVVGAVRRINDRAVCGRPCIDERRCPSKPYTPPSANIHVGARADVAR